MKAFSRKQKCATHLTAGTQKPTGHAILYAYIDTYALLFGLIS